MTEKPFVHKVFANVKTSFTMMVAKILFKLLNKKNHKCGGKNKTIFDFAKEDNPKIKKFI